MVNNILLLSIFTVICVLNQSSYVTAQYEDARCKCICPNLSVVNTTHPNNSARKHYIGNVPPNKCNCDNVVLPKVADDIKGKEQEFCPRCECKYESRNTTTIKVVVIIVMWAISLLVIYMLFLICLDPLLNQRAAKSYQEHMNDEEEEVTAGGSGSHPMRERGSGPGRNVLNRVGHQQDKWKRQVKEQRRNIYDRHTMLN